eukprot:1462924-Amphidinium_carterae.1
MNRSGTVLYEDRLSLDKLRAAKRYASSMPCAMYQGHSRGAVFLFMRISTMNSSEIDDYQALSFPFQDCSSAKP